MSAAAIPGTVLALIGATLAGAAVVRLGGAALSRRERVAWSMAIGAGLLAGASLSLMAMRLVPGPKKLASVFAVLAVASWLLRRSSPRRPPAAPARAALGVAAAEAFAIVLVALFALETVRGAGASRAPAPQILVGKALYAGGLADNPALSAMSPWEHPLVPAALSGLASAVRAWDVPSLALLEPFLGLAAVLLVSGFLARRASRAAGAAAGVLVALSLPFLSGGEALMAVAASLGVALAATAALDALESGSMATVARLLLGSLFAVAASTDGALWIAALCVVIAARGASDRRVPRAALLAAALPLFVAAIVFFARHGMRRPADAGVGDFLSRLTGAAPSALAAAAMPAALPLLGIGLVLLATRRGSADPLIPAVLLDLGFVLAVSARAPLWHVEDAISRAALVLFPAVVLIVAARVFPGASEGFVAAARAPAFSGVWLGAGLVVLAGAPSVWRAAAGEPRVEPLFVPRPTFHGSVEPILQAHCQTCHHDGGIAPFSLTSYAGAAERARDIRSQVASRRMPPWKAKPGCELFGNDPSLPEKDIATLVRWVDAGAPEGNPKDAPPPRLFSSGWDLGQPDLVLKAPVFTPDFSKGDLYQCFVLPTNLDENAWISAVEVRPGNRKMVHHALLYVEEGIQSREREAEGPGPGYPCFGGARVPVTDSFGEWAPGMQARFYPPGTARFLPRKSRIIMQVHYSAMSGEVEPDHSEVGVYFAKDPVHRRLLSNDVRSDAPFTIPADAVSHTLRGRLGPLDSRAELVAILPHMHLLGKTMKVTARLPGGVEKCLVDVDDWDLRWQRTYYYAKPVVLPKGTMIDLEATFDNSYANPNNPVEAHVDVHFGEHTTDEMCMALLFWTVDGRNPGEREAFFKGQVCGTSPIPRPTATPIPTPR